VKIEEKMHLIRQLSVIHNCWNLDNKRTTLLLKDGDMYKEMSRHQLDIMLQILTDTVMAIAKGEKQRKLLINYYYSHLEQVGLKHVTEQMDGLAHSRGEKEFPMLKPLTSNQIDYAHMILKKARKLEKYPAKLQLLKDPDDNYMFYYNDAPIGEQIFNYYADRIMDDIKTNWEGF
jgi:hypothetical protein